MLRIATGDCVTQPTVVVCPHFAETFMPANNRKTRARPGLTLNEYQTEALKADQKPDTSLALPSNFST